MLDILRSVVLEAIRVGGHVLDGLPHTLSLPQAAYQGVRNIGAGASAVVYLHAAEADLVRRLLVRAEWKGRAEDTEQVIGRRREP